MSEAGEEKKYFCTSEELVEYLQQRPGRGKLSQEAENQFTCIQLGPKWQAVRPTVVAACQEIFQFHKKIQDGKHNLLAKLRTAGIVQNADDAEFSFFFPLSPSGFHISLKPPNPSQIKSVVGTPVKFSADKVRAMFGNLLVADGVGVSLML